MVDRSKCVSVSFEIRAARDALYCYPLLTDEPFPFFTYTDAPALLNFLGSYACFLSGVAAIMITDFYLVRRGRIDMREYYNFPGGIYWYWFGFNWRAIAAWVISFAPNLPGLIVSF